jgi:hypothetical protein
LREALKHMPVPPARPGFIDAALAKAASSARTHGRPVSRSVLTRWEMWFGVAVGIAATILVSVFLLRPHDATEGGSNITLAVNESRNVDVVIDSERTLEDATIRVAASGSVELKGLDDKHEVQWQTRVERGRNVVSLPVIARSTGDAQLVAVIEHGGRKRRVGVNLSVTRPLRQKVA